MASMKTTLRLTRSRGDLPRKKKPSKHTTTKQLRRARELFIEERCKDIHERLALALARRAEYSESPLRRTEAYQKRRRLWEAEVLAAQLYRDATIESAGEYFDRIMAMVADPEFEEA